MHQSNSKGLRCGNTGSGEKPQWVRMLAVQGLLAHLCPGVIRPPCLQIAKDFNFTLQSMLSLISSGFSCCQNTHIFYALNFGSNGLEYLWIQMAVLKHSASRQHSVCRNTVTQAPRELSGFHYSKLSSHNF